jgi:hypothetical protein
MVPGNFMVTPAILHGYFVDAGPLQAGSFDHLSIILRLLWQINGVNIVSGIIRGKGLSNIYVLGGSSNYMPGRYIGFLLTLRTYIFFQCYRKDLQRGNCNSNLIMMIMYVYDFGHKKSCCSILFLRLSKFRL